jgi:hypothetical protein
VDGVLVDVKDGEVVDDEDDGGLGFARQASWSFASACLRLLLAADEYVRMRAGQAWT